MNRLRAVTETWIPKRVLGWLLIIGVAGVSAGLTATADDGLVERASATQRRAVDFFHDQVAVNGGYVYQVSSDLKWREGEGDAGQTSVWVQPPGTPAVGLAYIEAYRRTGEKFLLDAARDTATCLVKGQLHSGGWQNHIDFDSPLREKLAYRIDGPPRKKARNWSSFDDNQTQAALKFLMTLDQTLELQDTQLHEVVQTALAGVLRNQFPNGAWAQGFEELDPTQNFPIQAARYPADWPRKHPGGDYWRFYTLNDHALVRVLETMWLAGEIYGDERYRGSALRAADFLIQAQMPEPQPAWAQQYNYQMEPVWARKFEPPAVSGGESQQVIEALMQVATWTGDPKYLKPIGPALDYLERSQLPSGRMARFYELKTNRPLYFNRQYELTYDDSDLPTHYGFITPSNLKRLRQRYNQLQALNSQQLIELGQRQRKTTQVPSDKKIAEIIAAIDERGAWVERGKMRSIKAVTGEIDVISSATFIENLDQLSRYLAGKRPRP